MKMVMIDPGHGGHDPGAAEGDLIEKHLNLRLAKMIAERLKQQYVVDVRMTRETDHFIELSERADMANQAGADYFVSIHHNRSGGDGFESFVYPGTQSGKTGQMQKVIHDHIIEFMRPYGVRDRGRKTANFAVLRETRMPAVLLEYLFVDHPEDARRLRNDAFVAGAAQATVDGIAAAMNLPRKQADQTDQDSTVSNDFPAWKKEAVDWLFREGLLTDEAWRKKLDEPVPLWALAVMLRRWKAND